MASVYLSRLTVAALHGPNFTRGGSREQIFTSTAPPSFLTWQLNARGDRQQVGSLALRPPARGDRASASVMTSARAWPDYSPRWTSRRWHAADHSCLLK